MMKLPFLSCVQLTDSSICSGLVCVQFVTSLISMLAIPGCAASSIPDPALTVFMSHTSVLGFAHCSLEGFSVRMLIQSDH